jgi:hypothetical protein
MQNRNGAVEGAEKIRGALLFDLARRVNYQDGIRGDAYVRFRGGPKNQDDKKNYQHDDYNRSPLAPSHGHSPLPTRAQAMPDIAG